MNSRLRLLALFAVVATISLLAAACGGDEPTPRPQPSAATATATAPPTVTPTATQVPPAPTPPPTPTSVPAPTPTPPTPASPPTVPPFVPTPTPTVAPTPTSASCPQSQAKGGDQQRCEQLSRHTTSLSIFSGLFRDVTLYEDEEGTVANSKGAYFFVGSTNRRELRRSLIAFDVTESVPEGATVTGVQLTLSMSRTAGLANDISLHRAIAAWNEGPSATVGQGGTGAAAEAGDPTWLHSSFDTERWATVGGDFDPVASATTTVVAIGSYVWEGTPELAADVQSWIDDPSINFGWALIGEEDSAKPAKRFDSREHDNESNRPLLVIDFTTP